ncbi:inner nuclear membrane protein Man1 [Nerophis lumbriciformis]|uniref:inner nuclear membrane protein Man1 n=1 Tax=Nerophis lumbriciformis TaxID=546530 RepID=UPI002AE06178|nr:inner nuclear membrane protein Man1-like [Nerophis lumbriciformis]
MASTQLTDEDLYSELKRFGFTPGPVTESTRPVYLKKLKKLREERQQQQRGVRAAKARSGGGAINSNTAGFGPASRDVTHLSSSRRPGRKSTVLGFSSDESDTETPLKRSDGGAKQQAKYPAGTPGVKSRHGAGSTLNNFPDGVSASWGLGVRPCPEADGRDCGDSEDEFDGGDEKSCHSLNGSRASNFNASKLAGNYSDSEEEGGWGLGGDRQRGSLDPRQGHAKAGFSPHVVPHGSNTTGGVNMVGKRHGENEGDGVKRNDSRRKTIYVSLAENHMGTAGKNHHADKEDINSSRFSTGLRPRFSTYSSLAPTYRANHSNHNSPNHSYSSPLLKEKPPAPPEDDIFQQFKREEVATASSFSAHYLSMFLLTAACLFFLLLGLMYLRMRGNGSTEVDVVVKNHPFGSEFDDTYDKPVRDLILKLLLNLHDHLAHIAGRHDCGEQQYPNRSLSIAEASAYLMTQNEEFEDLIYSSLEWIIRTNQDVGIRLIGQAVDEPIIDVSEISRLESTHPQMPFTCRFRRAFLTVISRVFLFVAVIGSVWGLVCYVKYHWRKEEEETRQMYHMVERIIDVLRSHSEACQENQDFQPYLPIPHVRDSLIQPQERKKMKRIWERSVSFLSANESRIRTETQIIGGADYLVWRWIHPSQNCDKTSSIPSKVWQGKAFPLDRRNSPPNSLTPCLKIRNMFDPVMEVGDNWDLAIHEAILEKCSDNKGIVHIAVDKNSREGCVYVKCLSAEHSGKAFKALHGSWFDGKLVTVKYLRLDRYHQRFPQAQACSTPLKAFSLHTNAKSTTNTTPGLQPRGSADSSGFS